MSNVNQRLFNYMKEEHGVTLLESDINEIKLICAEEGKSDQFYCVSSDALVYGNPCKKWCGDEHCKALCKQ